MKTIFLFDDSRITDLWSLVVALGEDGTLVTAVKFSETTAPHAKFAMGATHELDESLKPCVTDPLWGTREFTLSKYDAAYGPGNWMPVWIDLAAGNVACTEAIRLFRLRQQQEAVKAASEASARLAGFIGAIFAAPEEMPQSMH